MNQQERLTLKSARMMRGLTQAEMAEKLNVHRNTYAHWEEDPKSISVAKANEICAILNVSIDNIVFFGY